jgi:sugar porter (SP) family MFS transporter
MNQRLIVTALSGSLCGFLFGYDIGAMASAAPNVRSCFGLSPTGLGLAVSSALFGTILGSVIAGRTADAFGRRSVLSVSAALYALATVSVALSGGLLQFAASRFLCGAAIGLISVSAPMYLAEISPPELRGRIVGCFQLSVSIGVVIAFSVGYVLSLRLSSETTWRLLLGGAIVPVLMCQLCLLHSCPSPRWLVVRGRIVEACSSLKSLGAARPHVDTDAIVASLDATKVPVRTSLFSRQYIYPIVLAVSIALFNQLTGVNALLFYVLDVFKDLGSGRLNGRADAVILSGLSFIVTMIAVLVIDRLGRKPLLLAGAAGMGICLMLLPAIRQHNWKASAVVIVLACYNACFGFSQGAVIWVYLSEIFPLPVRARGQSLGTTVLWVTNAFVVGAFPVITSRLGQNVFFVLAWMMALQFLIILLFFPETKGRTLERLSAGGGGLTGHEDLHGPNDDE